MSFREFRQKKNIKSTSFWMLLCFWSLRDYFRRLLSIVSNLSDLPDRFRTVITDRVYWSLGVPRWLSLVHQRGTSITWKTSSLLPRGLGHPWVPSVPVSSPGLETRVRQPRVNERGREKCSTLFDSLSQIKW